MTNQRDATEGGRFAGHSLVGWLLTLGASAAVAAAPAASAPPPPHPQPAAKAASATAGKLQPAKRIDINSASRAQLKALPGIGDAEADKIVAHRPYLTSTEIVTKAGLPAGVYVAIKRQIVAMPKTLPKARPPAKSSS